MENTRKHRNAKDIFVTIGASNHGLEDREENDFYATAPKAVEKLLEKETFSKDVYECACGQGHISKVLKEHGYNVHSSDLINRGYGEVLNFFQIDKIDGDIITNPPYKLAIEFVYHALEIVNEGNKVAFLLKIQFLESEQRRKLFNQYPPKYVYVFSNRVICAKNGEFEKYTSSAICYAWFIWIKGEATEPIIRWL